MLIHLTDTITPAEEADLTAFVRELRYKPTSVRTQSGAYLVAIGTAEVDLRAVGRRRTLHGERRQQHHVRMGRESSARLDVHPICLDHK